MSLLSARMYLDLFQRNAGMTLPTDFRFSGNYVQELFRSCKQIAKTETASSSMGPSIRVKKRG